MQSLTAIVLTYNEAPNIERTLHKLQSIPKVIVLDSFSTDETVRIAQKFANVNVYERVFDEHTKQWEFAREQVETEWVLALDADYQFSEILLQEIHNIIEREPEENGFMANFVYAIDGEVISSGIYPPVCVLFRKEKAMFVKDGHTQRLHVEGKTGELRHTVIHDDRKDFRRWLNSQISYAQLEAEKLASEQKEKLSKNDKIRLKSKFTPIFVFIYCIFVRRGWKDGRGGWKYAFQRLIAEILLQYYLLDIKH
ncbi:glycosyltransferase family 2 protein [bacterium]|nr:MAG: glycosyltransferase family 2 protein [bacterium]